LILTTLCRVISIASRRFDIDLAVVAIEFVETVLLLMDIPLDSLDIVVAVYIEEALLESEDVEDRAMLRLSEEIVLVLEDKDDPGETHLGLEIFGFFGISRVVGGLA
jgi:hypothetical protein